MAGRLAAGVVYAIRDAVRDLSIPAVLVRLRVRDGKHPPVTRR
jgi:hypothetical protein